MENAKHFRQKLAGRVPCLGTCVTFTDPTVTEALAGVLDFLWIDMEHNPLTLEKVQGHIMATRGTAATPLVRVAWNDPAVVRAEAAARFPGPIHQAAPGLTLDV